MAFTIVSRGARDDRVDPPNGGSRALVLRRTLWSVPLTENTATFWWDAGRPADASLEPLRAVIFELDGALADLGRDGRRPALDAAVMRHGHDIAPREGLDHLVNSLFFAGIPVAVVSAGARSWVQPLVRQLLGDGIAQTIVTPDDLHRPGADRELYGHALWELGVGSDAALAVTGSGRGLRAAAAAKVATLVVTTPCTAGQDFTGAAEVRSSYDGVVATSCETLHRRWWRAR